MSSTVAGKLEGKVALISGTGGGQGQIAALRFAREGARVFGCDTNREGHEATCAMLRDEGLSMGGIAPLDLGDPEQARAWVEAAVAEFGTVDILYNNASSARFGDIGEMPIADWQYTIRNELDLVFYCTHYAWPHLKKQGGVVINISSVAGWGGSTVTGIAAHAAAKGGVIAMTRQLAVDGAKHGIRAVSISPGFIATPGTEKFLADPKLRQALLDGVLMDRAGKPEEVVNTALFVASSEASFITGTDIVVDGGLMAV